MQVCDLRTDTQIYHSRMSLRIQVQYSSENNLKIGLQNLFRKTEFAINKRDANMHGGMPLKGQKRQMIFHSSCLFMTPGNNVFILRYNCYG